ncbi:tagaturonate reductase [Alicyclobacillus acidoterrestris]|uniref:Tagaturonate reductase n=1 Tax=Alicyclobacillus acidoterrestris (strain ATCC 49025 / DSM 3922 / CIP 106132 / NCIMB 13137 / GD3B) TaxID=1356854 RepID=T0BXL2_ALIAG|nr:tagaturonate reductase [Alicyclobacillus acidoterrestris]EPZ45524.1 hypothetical protein N007_08760 [Alicyclobacillus acidoterrestris ATCC 49025]UNO49498.1 tagaturonate reductase [Alicyclobacillus acidoterrestris]
MQLSVQLDASHRSVKFPERIIQIGEGNFLRGFVDWMIHQLNKQGLYEGSVVVVAPRPSGATNIARLNAQDGLFTVCLRGIHQGINIDDREIVSSIRRGIDPHQDWSEFLRCAENPTIDILVSNTTESGIQYVQEDYQMGQPLMSFPGKLTAYLHHRYTFFQGAAAAGMTIVPCELIEDNGEKLREIVLRHAADWGLPTTFQDWIRQHNHFCNTLVDRIVTGFPKGTSGQELLDSLGYRDELVTVGEPYHLWAIEADDRLAQAWPFEKIGLNVRYVADVTPYRVQKVRILNGAHTAMAALGLLAGLSSVREVVIHPVFGPFIHGLLFGEVVPTLADHVDSEDQLEEFANAVMERFANPYIHHELTSLTLNGLSKIRVRLLPTLNDYYARYGRAPRCLSAALAGQLLFYRNADNPLKRWPIQDDSAWVSTLEDIWAKESTVGLEETVAALLRHPQLWGQDLTQLDGLHAQMVAFIRRVRQNGVVTALQSVAEVL